jgi:hypothetical protein
VVWDTRQDRMGSVNLFERHNEGHLVLKSQSAERPEEIRGFTHAVREAIGSADQQRASFARIAFNSLHLLGECAAGKLFSPLIEHYTIATFAATEQLVSFTERL